MKTVAVIGSTGSIGTQALDVIRHRRKEFQVAALSCHENLPLLYQQIEEFHPHVVGISDEAAYREAKAYLGERVKLLGGSEAHSGCVEAVSYTHLPKDGGGRFTSVLFLLAWMGGENHIVL